MTHNVTSITDYDHTYLLVVHEGVNIYIRKEYTEIEVNVDDTDIVELRWHWYENNSGKRVFYLDYNTVATPSTASADELNTVLNTYLNSQFHYPTNEITSDHTLALVDAKRNLVVNSVSQVTITIPANSAVDFHVGEKILIFPYNTGVVTVEPDTGVLLLSDGDANSITGPYTCAELLQVYTDVWRFCGSIATYIDPDVQDFLDATGITDDTIINAVNTFIIALKAAGLYTRHIALWLCVGGTAALHKWNFVNPLDTDAAFRLTFTGSWTHDSTGMDPDGSTAYARTYLTPSAVMTTDDGAMGYYGGEDVASAGTQRQFGCFTSGASPSLSVGINRSGSSVFDYNNHISNRITVSSPTITNTNNLYTNSRTDGSTHRAYESGSQIGGTDTVANASGSPAIEMLLGAVNIAASGITPSSYTSLKCQGAFVTDAGFSVAEMATYGPLWDAFQTDLGR